MKKKSPAEAHDSSTKKGYNEKNPGQSQGAFHPDAHEQPAKTDRKSNAADKKKKEDTQ